MKLWSQNYIMYLIHMLESWMMIICIIWTQNVEIKIYVISCWEERTLFTFSSLVLVTGQFSIIMSYNTLVRNVGKAFETGRTKSLEWRISQLEAVTRFWWLIILNNDEIISRMLNENEDQFVAALKSDLNKPFQESITSEIDMLKNVKYSSKV